VIRVVSGFDQRSGVRAIGKKELCGQKGLPKKEKRGNDETH